MKAISLIQPYASLIANGNKHIETRSWATKHRGYIFIHASANMSKEYIESYYNNYHIRVALSSNYDKKTHLQLPKGQIIAVADLYDCKRMICVRYASEKPDSCINIKEVPIPEYNFGLYEEGRYAWMLRDIRKLKNPIPSKGKLSLWDYPLSIEQLKNYNYI